MPHGTHMQILGCCGEIVLMHVERTGYKFKFRLPARVLLNLFNADIFLKKIIARFESYMSYNSLPMQVGWGWEGFEKVII